MLWLFNKLGLYTLEKWDINRLTISVPEETYLSRDYVIVAGSSSEDFCEL